MRRNLINSFALLDDEDADDMAVLAANLNAKEAALAAIAAAKEAVLAAEREAALAAKREADLAAQREAYLAAEREYALSGPPAQENGVVYHHGGGGRGRYNNNNYGNWNGNRYPNPRSWDNRGRFRGSDGEKSSNGEPVEDQPEPEAAKAVSESVESEKEKSEGSEKAVKVDKVKVDKWEKKREEELLLKKEADRKYRQQYNKWRSLEDYEKLLAEKRKVLGAVKKEERKVQEIQGMKLVAKKKSEEKKPEAPKIQKKKPVEKKAEAPKIQKKKDEKKAEAPMTEKKKDEKKAEAPETEKKKDEKKAEAPKLKKNHNALEILMPNQSPLLLVYAEKKRPEKKRPEVNKLGEKGLSVVETKKENGGKGAEMSKEKGIDIKDQVKFEGDIEDQFQFPVLKGGLVA